MGQTGSFTSKIEVPEQLTPFTKWELPHVREMLTRSENALSDTFALRFQEIIFLIGRHKLSLADAKYIFHDVFDTDSNKLIDKFELMSGVILLSAMSSEEKVECLYDIFDFNMKGFLVVSEVVLLLHTVTKCASKIDYKMAAPPMEKLREIGTHSMDYCLLHENSLRKYELVTFAADYPPTRAFLEAFRGHVSQVLLASYQLWQDLHFTSHHTSIAPSNEWLNMGLPPQDFVTWRRRKKVLKGCEMIFGHAEKYSKTCDFPLMEGEGAIASGTLQQGLLADRWVMNAVAVYIAQPATLRHLFGTTGQEDVGRFCIRLFEGRGWNSVFVDDRIPCDPIKCPLFMRSSCDNECWPMVLEKGIAKSLGSYGHLAACGIRNDSTEVAMKWLSGGHVSKLRVLEYEWLTIPEEVTGRDGALLCQRILLEGSNISFGKSEPRMYHVSKVKKKRSKKKLTTSKWTFPFGRLFPLLGIEFIKHYKYFVFRDAWGLIPHAETEHSAEYGHIRTFKVKLEDIPVEFDTMFFVRFPDSIKAQVYKESKRFLMPKPYYVPWVTEVLNQTYTDIISPARFYVRVFESPEEGVLGRKEDKKAKSKMSTNAVEIAFSVSCTKPWGECCDLVDHSPPKLFGRITATDETRKALQAEGKVLEDVLDSTRVRFPKDIPKDFQPKTQTSLNTGNKISEEASMTTTGVGGGVGSTVLAAGSSMLEQDGGSIATVDTKTPEELEREREVAQYKEELQDYDFPFCCQSSWASHSFKLWPGEYILSVYVEESRRVQKQVEKGMKISKKKKSKIEKKVEERSGDTPRESFIDLDLNNKGAWAHLSSVGRYTLNSVTAEEMQTNQVMLQHTCLSEMQRRGLPLEEMGPFLADQQQEAGSKGMMDVVARARAQADELNVQMMELRHGEVVSVLMQP